MTISGFLHKHSTSLTLTLAFTVGAATATTAIFSSIAIRRELATRQLKDSIPDLSASHHAQQLTEFGAASPPQQTLDPATQQQAKDDERAARIAARARQGQYDEELVLEQLARNRVFLRDDGLAKLRGSFVVVVGLGGVGSHCVAALARSGVERIRVVDFDQVTLSSLNRHALATLADVGTPKVQCVRKRLEQICPWVRIEARNELFGSTSAEKLLGPWDYELRDHEEVGEQKPDFVVDAIDNIDSKVGLLQYCVQKDIKVVSAMGAGCKSDPTQICVGDISTSTDDPLSKSTRRRLKILGIKGGVPVVYSTEKPGEGKAELLPIAEDEFKKGDVGDLGVLPDFRVRILPVLGTMPAVFGYTVANFVICSISGYPMDYRIGDRGREKLYESMLSSLQGLEQRLVRSANEDPLGLRIPITHDDIGYLVEEIFRGKSVITGLATRLALIRWRRPEGGFKFDDAYAREGQKAVKLAFSDLVLMTKEEAQRHEKVVLIGGQSPEDVYDAPVLETVRKRHADVRAYDKYR